MSCSRSIRRPDGEKKAKYYGEECVFAIPKRGQEPMLCKKRRCYYGDQSLEILIERPP